jgi:glucosamine--fructose-6-phosphate aminotransferase (isomerizing)
MCGIFGYLNYLCPRTRFYILEALVKGLKRLEYRGYDSAGLAFDGDDKITVQGQSLTETRIMRQQGKVNALSEIVFCESRYQ